jgi:hypothetical protein
MKNVGIFCGHLVHISPPPPFWYVLPRKIWQPCSRFHRRHPVVSLEKITLDFLADRRR